jgi:hypothetical protein
LQGAGGEVFGFAGKKNVEGTNQEEMVETATYFRHFEICLN